MKTYPPMSYKEAKKLIDSHRDDGTLPKDLYYLCRALHMNAYYSVLRRARIANEKAAVVEYEKAMRAYRTALDTNSNNIYACKRKADALKQSLPPWYGKGDGKAKETYSAGKTIIQRAVERSEKEYVRRAKWRERQLGWETSRKLKQERIEARARSRAKLGAVIGGIDK